MAHAQVAATSLEGCAAACCAAHSCTVYQWCADGAKCDGATGTGSQCWTGQESGCDGANRQGWQGMGRGGIGPRPSGPVSVQGVRIAHNSMGHGRGTQATATLTQTAATSWAFDFCEQLVFPQIAIVRVHVVAASGFPRAVARPPAGCKVMVETSEPVTGTVTVDVDSSEPSAQFI